ncbi:MAG TPA: hypothetical protein P5042_04975 [Candidatus Izemoplasmatales bacterium]|nr:hypothetical protein [Candidatus Izemoplasmatales bacterium]
MICAICRKAFVAELEFSTLFHPPILCGDCLTLRKAEPIMEAIPTDNGLIEYYYLCEQNDLDTFMYSRSSHFIEKALEMAICRYNEIGFVIILEPDDFTTLESWWPFVKETGTMIFFSFFRYDFLTEKKDFCF